MAIGLSYYVEFITVPALALLMATLTTWNALTGQELVAGYLFWIAIEWWMHAKLFHVYFRKRHWKHHLHPFDQEGSPGTLTAHLLLAITALGACALDVPAAACGLFLGYGSYIFTHHAIHARWLSERSAIRRRHELHHRGIEKNFNLLNPLGDLLMGTYAL
jgi:hypothetical protein